MSNPFQVNLNESILYRSQPLQKWYVLVWRIGLELLEVALFMLFSFTALASLSRAILGTFLPTGLSDMLSRIVFQDIVPILVIAWFAEDIARIFTSELILTNQRVWTKGSPYAWTPERETLLSDIKSMSCRRDALFIHLKSTKKTQVHIVLDNKQVVQAFIKFTGKSDSD